MSTHPQTFQPSVKADTLSNSEYGIRSLKTLNLSEAIWPLAIALHKSQLVSLVLQNT